MVDVREEIRRMELEGSTHSRGMMDIRFFIGLLFVLYGFILAVFGFMEPDLAAASLGINLNRDWGIFLFVFGLAFLLPSKKPSQWNK